MANTKIFTVTADLKIVRPIWRNLGFGDQPSKAEVTSLLNSYLKQVSGPGSAPAVVVRYMGAPGHYKAVLVFSVNQPWWRRWGFGDTTSKAEVTGHLTDFLNNFSREVVVSATIQSGK